MKKRLSISKNNKGFILIFALWVLGFLTLIVVQIGFGARQKIALLKRIEDRAQLQKYAELGIKKSVAIISEVIAQNPASYTALSKRRIHNNPEEFQNINFSNNEGDCKISYQNESQQEFFGVIDEERKLNINRADPWMVRQLIETVLDANAEQALSLAGAIYKWRQSSLTQEVIPSQDNYYENLENSFPQKKEPFEHIDELLLIHGMDKLKFEKLNAFLTVYGDGQVNINTASIEVLLSLGLPASIIEKILIVRRGKDQVEGTEDDHVFQRVFDIASDLNQAVKLEPGEAQLIDQLNAQGWLTTQSFFYTVQAQAELKKVQTQKMITILFNGREHWIEYWKEK